MADSVDMIMPMLREMRADLREFALQMHQHFDGIDRRLTRLEALQHACIDALSIERRIEQVRSPAFRRRLQAMANTVHPMGSGI